MTRIHYERDPHEPRTFARLIGNVTLVLVLAGLLGAVGWAGYDTITASWPDALATLTAALGRRP